MGGRGNAGGECLHIRYMFSDSLVSGLTPNIVMTAMWFIAIAPKRERDIAVAIKGEEGINAFPSIGDVGGAANEVMKTSGGGGGSWFDGYECMIIVEVVKHGETVGVVIVVTCDAM